MRQSFEQRRVAEAVAAFGQEVTGLVLEVLHEDGVYRHVRLRRPTSSMHWFELVTWPGKLAVAGDLEAFTFACQRDMFALFRESSWDGINPGYWAEKLVTNTSRVRSYDRDLMEQVVREHVAEAIQAGAPRGLARAVVDLLADEDLDDEDHARHALTTFTFKGWALRDVWEWTFSTWDWHYLRACHAIAWGIAQYDQHRAHLLAAQARARAGG